jgi:hypothetical protein
MGCERNHRQFVLVTSVGLELGEHYAQTALSTCTGYDQGDNTPGLDLDAPVTKPQVVIRRPASVLLPRRPRQSVGV